MFAGGTKQVSLLAALGLTLALPVAPAQESMHAPAVTPSPSPTAAAATATPTPPKPGTNPNEVAIANGVRNPPAAKEPPSDSVPIPIGFRSPFSLNDCQNLLNMANAALPQGENSIKQVDRESYLRLLDAVSNYLKERDDLHASLVGYRWEVLTRDRVKTGLPDSHEYIFGTPEKDAIPQVPQGVTAISFQVEVADALFHGMKVYDTQNKLVAEFHPDKPVTLRHSLPKREFFFLWQPTDIGKVTCALSKATPAEDVNPRVYLLAGRANKPEYGKSAIWLIGGAREAFKSGDIAATRDKVQRAQKDLRLFQDSLRDK